MRIHHRRDADFALHRDVRHLEVNDIGRCSLGLSAPLPFDPYRLSPPTGGFVLIDPVTRRTSAVGMLEAPELARANLV
jgi:bifunctional enzyme CysN/CysC